MNDQSPYHKAMRDAEKALLSGRKKRAPRDVAKPVPVMAPTAALPNEAVLTGGVSEAAMEAALAKLRSDINAVLDTIDKPQPMQIDITSNAVQVGSITGLSHYMLPQLLQLVSIKDARGQRMNIMLKGEMGGGKSTACKQIADGLKLPFDYIGQTLMPHDVVGFKNQQTGEYQHTAFTRIFQNGGVIVLEEMDGWSPNATIVINAALANGYLSLSDGSFIERHEDCVIIACTNTWGTGPTAKYVGRNKLDDAFLDRFGAKLDWKYDTQLERAAAGNDDVVNIVQSARLNARKAGVQVSISPRSSIDISKMVAAGIHIRDAINMNFGASLDRDQLAVVLEGCDVT